MIPRSSNRPGDLDALAPGTRHHMLDPGSAGSGSRSLDHARSTRRVSGHAGHDGLRRRGRRCASRQSAPSPPGLAVTA
jgi:hypothetical protein